MLISLEIFPRRFHQARTLINGFVSPLSDLLESLAITHTYRDDEHLQLYLRVMF